MIPFKCKRLAEVDFPIAEVRRFARPMGIDLNAWNSRIIGQDNGIVRLLSVVARAKDLFGEDGASAAADWAETDPGAPSQTILFPKLAAEPRVGVRRRERKVSLMVTPNFRP